MLSVAKFASRIGRLGEPLPPPYPIFDLRTVTFRHGATSMLAGKPGAGKSIFALNLMLRWAQENRPAFYFSADSDEYTVARRLGGMISGMNGREVEALSKRDLAALLAVDYLSPCRFEYRRPHREEPPQDFVFDRLHAYEAVYGDYPPIVFIDNLINYAPSATDWGAMIDFLVELDSIARETSSHICVLHHASRGYGASADPVPVDAIQGKVDQIPRLVLTIAAIGDARAVACVKNTNGPQDPEAKRFMTFRVHDSLQVTDDYQERV